jgi:EAL domain-containing protein (putative c-di-GMP-specific phosphodiesterase class I)
MRRLRGVGCSFALDDFGTGLSSLVYLKSLPVSVLKIDGAFVRDAGTNQRTESMVRAIAQLARTMGMETVAEYVETDELRTRMASLGVDYGQGFAIGRPVPVDQILGDLALYEAMAQQESPGG